MKVQISCAASLYGVYGDACLHDSDSENLDRYLQAGRRPGQRKKVWKRMTMPLLVASEGQVNNASQTLAQSGVTPGQRNTRKWARCSSSGKGRAFSTTYRGGTYHDYDQILGPNVSP